MKIGPGRSRRAYRIHDDDRTVEVPQPVLVHVRGAVRRVGAPHENARRVGRGTRVEPGNRGAEHVCPCDMPGQVADRIGLYFGRAQAVKEPQREHERQHRQCSRVVSVQHGCGTAFVDDLLRALRGFGQGVLPADGCEGAFALRADPAQRRGEAGLGVLPHAVVGRCALRAQRSPVDRVIWVAADDDPTILAGAHHDSAVVVAVTWAVRPHRRHDLVSWHSFTPAGLKAGLSAGFRPSRAVAVRRPSARSWSCGRSCRPRSACRTRSPS